MAQLGSIKEEFLGTIVHLEKSKLAATNTPVKYDFVAITSDGTIEKAIAQREVENNKLVGVIVEINNFTNEVLVLTKGVFKTTYFNTIDSVNITYGTKLYLSDVSAGKLKTSAPTTGVGKCISLMTKRGIYIDATVVQEIFMNQASYDAIKGNLDSFLAIQTKLTSLENSVNSFDLTPLLTEITNVKENLKNYTPLINIRTFIGNSSSVLDGLMSISDKVKLDGIATGATNYSHPTGDGNLHVPANSTTNSGKVLKAFSTSGSISWAFVDWSELTSKPTTLDGYCITDAVSSSDSRLTNARPASDVYAWAKSSAKPSYSYSEIGGDFIVNGRKIMNAADSWLRTYGATGWYNETYGGGVYMEDTTWVKVYNGKSFYVNGAILASGDITAFSDPRLKKIISKIENPIEKLNQLNGYLYERLDLNNKKEIGLLTSDVKKVLPELVCTLKVEKTELIPDGILETLDYSKITALLVEVCKSQQSEIDFLKQQLLN